jgi:hypothetical protein
VSESNPYDFPPRRVMFIVTQHAKDAGTDAPFQIAAHDALDQLGRAVRGQRSSFNSGGAEYIPGLGPMVGVELRRHVGLAHPALVAAAADEAQGSLTVQPA